MNHRQPPKSLEELQSHYYGLLKKEGFKDIEDHSFSDKPLKKWSGCQLTGTAEAPFPDNLFKKEESLLNNAEFQEICISISAHGNYSLTPQQIRFILGEYIEGKSTRKIAKSLNVIHVTVHRCIVVLKKWADFMDNDREAPEISTVIVRSYDDTLDAPMIYSTWRNALWFDEKRDERENEQFYRSASRFIRNLLNEKSTTVRIACLSDDPGMILGYAVLNSDHLMWVYIKTDYRKRGIAKLLTKGFKTIAIPATRLGNIIAREKNLETKKIR